jgi:hypothetical protein
MSWRNWMTACLLAVLLGVATSAIYTALTGNFTDLTVQKAAALPVPAEQAVPEPTDRRVAATRSRAAGTTTHRTSPPPTRAKASKAIKAKPPKARHKTSDTSEKSASKRGGEAKKGK